MNAAKKKTILYVKEDQYKNDRDGKGVTGRVTGGSTLDWTLLI